MSSGSCKLDKHRAGFHTQALVPPELAPSLSSQLLTPCSILKHDLPHAGVWALLLEATHPKLATDVFYVAGDRVVADSLCKPFSMGRNLFCVHSRKHLDDIPELKESKQRTNRKTLSEMSRALNQVLSIPAGSEPSTGLLRALCMLHGDGKPVYPRADMCASGGIVSPMPICQAAWLTPVPLFPSNTALLVLAYPSC